jgi:carbonic anhydrase/acetyltransferase-like protein (isoleucine patch superfamily)
LIIGAPARRLRALTDQERHMLEESAAHYVAQGQRYRRELVETLVKEPGVSRPKL